MGSSPALSVLTLPGRLEGYPAPSQWLPRMLYYASTPKLNLLLSLLPAALCEKERYRDTAM
jgi:hypothetical protein